MVCLVWIGVYVVKGTEFSRNDCVNDENRDWRRCFVLKINELHIEKILNCDIINTAWYKRKCKKCLKMESIL